MFPVLTTLVAVTAFVVADDAGILHHHFHHHIGELSELQRDRMPPEKTQYTPKPTRSISSASMLQEHTQYTPIPDFTPSIPSASMLQEQTQYTPKPTKETNHNLGQVVFAHVLFRHGSRMPLEFYRSDPYGDSSSWPFKVAQLTDIGKKQEYELGVWLRQRYNSLLRNHYDPEEIYVQSTDVDRTLMSAECVMGGLYNSIGDQTPGGRPTANSWEPVPIHTEPVLSDCVLGASATCPCAAYNAEVKRVHGLPEVKALETKFEEMYNYVSVHAGNEVRDFGAAIKIYDALSIEEEYNKTIPEWAQSIYPEPIREAGLYSFVLPTWTTLLQRLKIGPLLKEMVERFQAKRAGILSPDRKVWFYSAHDATISAFLNTLKVFDLHFPPYAACILMELRKIDEKYFVTLTYRNSSMGEPHLLPIKTFCTVCPIDQFLSLVQPVLPANWTQECQLPDETSSKYLWLAAIAISIITLGSVVTLLIIYFKKRKSSGIYLTMPAPFHGNAGVKNSCYQQDFTYKLPQ